MQFLIFLKPTVDSDVQEINSFAEGVIEDLEPQQDGLQAFLGGSLNSFVV